MTDDSNTKKENTMNDLADHQWRPVSMRPEPAQSIWVACEYDDGHTDVFQSQCFPTSDWPASQYVVAWKPYTPPLFTDHDRTSVQKLQNKLALKSSYVSLQDVLDKIDEVLQSHHAANTYSHLFLRQAIFELKSVKMQ